jgi:hypothetical protein
VKDLINDREIYSIEKVSEQIVIIFANSYVNPMSFLTYIEEKLVFMSFTGEVVFDLLLCNGNTENRILVGNVIQGKIDREAWRIVSASSLQEIVLERVQVFYKSNDVLVQRNFILSDQEKKILLW